MRIKSKFHFFIGLFCLLCFGINIVNHRDIFVLAWTGIAAFVNICIGLFDEEDV